MGMLIMLFTLLMLAGSIPAIITLLLIKKPGMIKFLAAFIAVWLAVYFAILIGTSANSSEKVLRLGEKKEFCGFYFDCHMKVAAKDVKSISEQAGSRGYEIDVEVSSDAKMARLGLYQPVFVLLDSAGRSFKPQKGSTSATEFSRRILPEETITGKLLFDVPESSRGLKLDVRMGGMPEGLIESFLIGDEDSFLHKRVFLGLDPGSAVSGDPEKQQFGPKIGNGYEKI